MPGQRTHFDQARNNRAHAEQLLGTWPDDPTALQWAVTAAFYCAVHCVEGYLAGRGLHSPTHVSRERHMANSALGVPASVFQAYRALKQRSEWARYLAQPFTEEQVRRDILETYLVTVTSFVRL